MAYFTGRKWHGWSRIQIFSAIFFTPQSMGSDFFILQTQDHYAKSQVFQAVIRLFFFYSLVIKLHFISDVFNSLNCILPWVVNCLQRHFLSFWILSLLVPSGSCNQKLLNCMLDPNFLPSYELLLCHRLLLPLANSLLSFSLGLWFFRSHHVFLSESSWVSFSFLVILFWCDFKQKNCKENLYVFCPD